MNFYSDWKKSMFDIERNKDFTRKYLNKDPETLEVFMNGSYDDLVFVSKFLLSIPISNFLYCIDHDVECKTEMIIQYSNLNNAIVDVPRVLKFVEKSLTFAELGKIIINAKEEGACKKYGENHAKLAAEISMVKLERNGATEVTNTAFGNFSVNLSDADRLELVKRLAIRNEFIKKIIYLSKKGNVSYMDVARKILSDSTASRRKSNVRQIVNLILNDNELLNNIVW